MTGPDDIDPVDDYRDDDVPFICPGCYAVNNEPHADYCPDAAIEHEREEGHDSWWEDDADGDDC